MSVRDASGPAVKRSIAWEASISELVVQKKMILQVVVLLGLFLVLYRSVLARFPDTWLAHDRLEGFLIPVISLYLVWLKRHELRLLVVKPVPGWGFPVVVLAGALLLVGEAGGMAVLGEFSIVMMTAGLVLLLLGKSFLKVLKFPIGYLLFMTSIGNDIVSPLNWPFQLLSAKSAGHLLYGLGYPTFVEEQYITLPHISLEVAEVCSGVNYLVSILAIGLPLAYLCLRTWWGWLALIVSSISIGIVANWVRIAIIGILADWGTQPLHGPLHIMQGMFVAWMGFLALFAGTWALSKVEKLASGNGWPGDTQVRQPHHGAPGVRSQWSRVWVGTTLILIAFVAWAARVGEPSRGMQTDLSRLPYEIGDWLAVPVSEDSGILRIENADAELRRAYVNSEGQRVHLYIAYMRSQRQGKEIVDYRTAPFHQDSEVVTVATDSGASINVNQRMGRDDQRRKWVLFWYDVDGKAIASRYWAKLATATGALLRARSSGAMVVVTAEVKDVAKADGARQAAQDFVEASHPLMRTHLP